MSCCLSFTPAKRLARTPSPLVKRPLKKRVTGPLEELEVRRLYSNATIRAQPLGPGVVLLTIYP